MTLDKALSLSAASLTGVLRHSFSPHYYSIKLVQQQIETNLLCTVEGNGLAGECCIWLSAVPQHLQTHEL